MRHTLIFLEILHTLGALNSPNNRFSMTYSLKCFYSLGSNLSSSDWTWVRERLTSRESMLDRPESSLTFYDFLESLNPESDEYDTDLEDNFEPLNLDDDRTGLTRYNKICDEKGMIVHIVSFKAFNGYLV